MRLRRVLREVKAFSGTCDAATLDAFVHLEAPPQKPVEKAVPAEKPEGKLAQAEVEFAETIPEAMKPETIHISAESQRAMEAASRLAGKGGEASGNRLVIGGLEFIKIPAGKFIMGSKDDNPLAFDGEKPQHTLELPEYWMAKFPLTNERYVDFKGKGEKVAPGWEKKKNHPVVNVSWKDAMAYCKWFNETYAGELRNETCPCICLPKPSGRKPPAVNMAMSGRGVMNLTKINAIQPRGRTPKASPRPWMPTRRAKVLTAAPIWLEMSGSGHIPCIRNTLTRRRMAVKMKKILAVACCAAVHSAAFAGSRAVRVRNLIPVRRSYYLGFRVCASPIS